MILRAEHTRTKEIVLAAASTALLVGGCNSSDPQGSATDGPLSSGLGSGGNSLDAPQGEAVWSGLFGSLVLCTTDGSEVTLTGVDHELGAGRPVSITTQLRHVDSDSDSDTTRRGQAWDPVLAFVGTYDDLSPQKIRSDAIGPVAGARVSGPCDKIGPGEAYDEILTTVTTGRSGAWIKASIVRYQANGETRELRIPWTYTTCGSALDRRAGCKPST